MKKKNCTRCRIQGRNFRKSLGEACNVENVRVYVVPVFQYRRKSGLGGGDCLPEEAQMLLLVRANLRCNVTTQTRGNSQASIQGGRQKIISTQTYFFSDYFC